MFITKKMVDKIIDGTYQPKSAHIIEKTIENGKLVDDKSEYKDVCIHIIPDFDFLIKEGMVISSGITSISRDPSFTIKNPHNYDNRPVNELNLSIDEFNILKNKLGL